MLLTESQSAEISDVSSAQYTTKRLSIQAIEELLYTPLGVLDHGFIRVVDYMGGDEAITQAARVSYGKGTKQVSQDRGLIRYLMRHWHTTPFEMCEIKLHVKLPIFIARQWIRHRTANVNEYSARYSILDKEFYIPQPEHLAVQSSANKQGRDRVLAPQEAHKVMQLLRDDATTCYQHYMQMMNMKQEQEPGETVANGQDGLARELARMNLTLNYYTQWYWKIDLHNLLHFLMLRADPHAQYEIQAYAEKILEVVKVWVPYTYEAFMDYRLDAVHLSAQMKEVLQRMIKGESVNFESSALTQREWDELMTKMDL
jgi:thymidylate synthase (FAD)